MGIYLCPYCGRSPGRTLGDGITTCENCQRVFDSSTFHKILSASWVARRHNVNDIEVLLHKCDLERSHAELVMKYISDELYTHDEFMHILRESFCLDKCA